MKKYQKVEKEFTVIDGENKIYYRQVAVGESCYVYEVKSNTSTHYELFQAKESLSTKTYEFYEKYPSEEDFGKWAWRFNSLPSAVGCMPVLKSYENLISEFEVQKRCFYLKKTVHLKTLNKG